MGLLRLQVLMIYHPLVLFVAGHGANRARLSNTSVGVDRRRWTTFLLLDQLFVFTNEYIRANRTQGYCQSLAPLIPSSESVRESCLQHLGIFYRADP